VQQRTVKYNENIKNTGKYRTQTKIQENTGQLQKYRN